MRLLEYESKRILKQYGLPVPDGKLVTAADAVQIEGPVVLKAQIPTGGRGKAGGILNAATGSEATARRDQLCANPVKGYAVKKVLIEQQAAVDREFFMAVMYDTVAKAPIVIFSSEGGVDVEALAVTAPEKVQKAYFTVQDGFAPHRAREVVSETGISGKLLLGISSMLSKLTDIFIDCDATLAEINPLALTKDGSLVALDCHLEIDDDALFRQKALAALEQAEDRQESARSKTAFERQAAEVDNMDHRGVAGRVIEFDGNLGLIIGGGGASLTAFDAIRAHGGKPANYCEIGGNPSVRKVVALTQLLLSKANVEKIAVIMNVVSNTRVDLVARGIIKGILESGREPAQTIAAFRIPGAWEAEGAKILSKYGVSFLDRTVSIDEAAAIAVKRIQSV